LAQKAGRPLLGSAVVQSAGGGNMSPFLHTASAQCRSPSRPRTPSTAVGDFSPISSSHRNLAGASAPVFLSKPAVYLDRSVSPTPRTTTIHLVVPQQSAVSGFTSVTSGEPYLTSLQQPCSSKPYRTATSSHERSVSPIGGAVSPVHGLSPVAPPVSERSSTPKHQPTLLQCRSQPKLGEGGASPGPAVLWNSPHLAATTPTSRLGPDWRLGAGTAVPQPGRLGSMPLREGQLSSSAQRSASQQTLHMATPTATRRHGVSPDRLSSRLSTRGQGREASNSNNEIYGSAYETVASTFSGGALPVAVSRTSHPTHCARTRIVSPDPLTPAHSPPAVVARDRLPTGDSNVLSAFASTPSLPLSRQRSVDQKSMPQFGQHGAASVRQPAVLRDRSMTPDWRVDVGEQGVENAASHSRRKHMVSPTRSGSLSAKHLDRFGFDARESQPQQPRIHGNPSLSPRRLARFVERLDMTASMQGHPQQKSAPQTTARRVSQVGEIRAAPPRSPPSQSPSAASRRVLSPVNQTHGSRGVQQTQTNCASSSSTARLGPEVQQNAASRQTSSRQPEAEVQVQDELEAGAHVKVGTSVCRITRPLGTGSFGDVWAAECQAGKKLALKEIMCGSQEELLNALFEGHLLNTIGSELHSKAKESSEEVNGIARQSSRTGVRGGPRIGGVPALVDCETARLGGDHWRVRLAMTRIAGEPLDLFLEHWAEKQWREGYSEAPQELLGKVSEALNFMKELLVQLAPVFEHIAKIAYHRDVNAHNILIHGDDRTMPNFGLVDFGLAVDAQCWQCPDASAPASRPTRIGVDGASSWHFLDVGGDCRYWPVSAWLQFLHGWCEVTSRPDLCREYTTQLDSHALGVTAVQVFAGLLPQSAAFAAMARLSGGSAANGTSVLHETHAVLRSWEAYWSHVTPLHSDLVDTFTRGGDWDVLKSRCIAEEVQSVVQDSLCNLRAALRDFAEACRLAPASAGLSAGPKVIEALMSLISGGEVEPCPEPKAPESNVWVSVQRLVGEASPAPRVAGSVTPSTASIQQPTEASTRGDAELDSLLYRPPMRSHIESVHSREDDGSTGHSAHLAGEVPLPQQPVQQKHPVVSRREAYAISSLQAEQAHAAIQVPTAGRVRRMASEQSLLPGGASGVSSVPDAGTGSTTVVDGALPTRQADFETAAAHSHVREFLMGAEAPATSENGSQGCELMLRLSQLSDKVERLAQAMARLDTREEYEGYPLGDEQR